MTPDAPAPKRIRNPARRGLAAETYRFPLRMPLETLFRDNQEYRILRYAFDAAERKLAILQATGAPSGRLKTASARLNAASGKCAEFLLRNLPQVEPTGPVVLARELSDTGELVSETETPAEVTK